MFLVSQYAAFMKYTCKACKYMSGSHVYLDGLCVAFM